MTTPELGRAGDLAAPSFEYLGGADPVDEGDGAPRRRGPMIAGAVIAVVVVIVAALLWGNEHARTSANDDLSSAFRTATQRAEAGERLVIGTVAYASPMIWSSEVGPDVRAGLRALVQNSAAQVVAQLDDVRARAAGVRVLPWHAEQQRARDEVLALVDAQRARFAGIARDARDIDLVLAGGPLPTGAAATALRVAGAQ